MKVIWWLWEKSLWLTLPISVLFFSMFGIALMDYYSIEQAVQSTQKKPFSHYFYSAIYRNVASLESKIRRRELPFNQQNINVDVMYFTVQQSDINALNQNLPQSGKEYKPSLMHVNGDTLQVRLRYRGSNAKHWRDFKKSMRVKIISDEKYDSLTEFDLIVPSRDTFVGAYLAHQLANKMNLYGPKTKIVWVYINGEAFGLYLLQETISESTMLNQKRMPGDIYAGDIAEEDAFVGGESTVFDNAQYWEKIAKSSDYPAKNRAPLKALINYMEQPPENFRVIQQLLDYESFAKFYLFNYLVASVNVDDQHNWRLYYDYNLARFYPIVWDAEGWQKLPQEEGNAHSLDDFLLRDPAFASEIQKQWRVLQEHNVLTDFVIQSQKALIDLEPWLRVEPKFQKRSSESVFRKPHQYREAMIALIEERFKQTPQIVKLELNPNIKKREKILEWKDSITLDGVTHIHQPLTIYPGTRVRLMPKASLIFHDLVEVKGREGFPVIFEQALEGKPYGAIVFTEGASGSFLRYCNISGGTEFKTPIVQYPAMLAFANVENILVENCDIHDNASGDNMVHAVYSQVSFINSELHHAQRDALDTELSSIYIEKTDFHHNGKESIDTMASLVLMRSSRVYYSGDNGISVGQNSYMDIASSILNENVFGLLAKDSSVVRIKNSVIENNKIAFRAYRRNEHYSAGGKIFVYGSKVVNNNAPGEIEKKSKFFAVNSELPDDYFIQSKRIFIISTADPTKTLEQDEKAFKPVADQWPFNKN